MKVTDVYKGNFLTALHVKDADAVLTIKKAVEPNAEKCSDGRPIDRPIVYFEETDLGLICNATNFRCIGHQHGNDTKNWPGKKIKIYATHTDAFGKKKRAVHQSETNEPIWKIK